MPTECAAALRRRASRARCLQPAGLCGRSPGMCSHKGVFAKSTARVYPPTGVRSTLGPERCLGGQAAGATRAGSSSPASGWEEGAQGRGGCGPLGTPVSQLRGRFRALCAFSDTLAGSPPSPATGTERTWGSELRAVQRGGAAERALSFPTGVCKSELENSRRAQPPPSSPAPPQPRLGVGGVPPG